MSTYLVQEVSSSHHRYRHGIRCESEGTRIHFSGFLEGQIAAVSVACYAIKQSFTLVVKDDRVSNGAA